MVAAHAMASGSADSSSGIGQVLRDRLEHLAPTHDGGQNALDVFHDKDSRGEVRQDSQILSVEKVLRGSLGTEAIHVSLAGPPDQRIRLARRSSDQDNLVMNAAHLSYSSVEASIVGFLTQGEIHRPCFGLLPNGAPPSFSEAL